MAQKPRGQGKTPAPFSLVIFGASGDLTRRKLIPAVYGLFREGLLPDDFSVIGFARREKTDQSFRTELAEAAKTFVRGGSFDEAVWAEFAPKIHYHRSTFEDPDGFRLLRERLSANGPPGNRLFYLAAQPNSITAVVEQLRDTGLAEQDATGGSWARIVVEKPFGRDLATAQALNAKLGTAFAEDQVFRIDHYLGKETVQNLLVLRFANSIFEPIWNQKYVDHVQIAVSETMGMEGRGAYYEQAGALRDIVQNHIMHLLSLVAMEPPGSLDPDAVRDEKVKVLRALRPIPEECVPGGVVRAQYTAGTHLGGPVPGYQEEDGVAPESCTETYVAFKALIDNWRWAGVPFYIRTGKRLAARVTEISVHFKPVPQVLFNTPEPGPMQPNVLAIRIQPNEGISLRFQVKVPGPAVEIRPFQMDFGYGPAFGKEPPEAYERLLLDAALGDATLFTRGDEVAAAWRFVAPIVACCEACAPYSLPAYPAGSWGPKEADELIEADGRSWQILRRPRAS
ncbi:MAG: glucose-6-phosphate dehydrogenase [Planctomycetota bacterium]